MKRALLQGACVFQISGERAEIFIEQGRLFRTAEFPYRALGPADAVDIMGDHHPGAMQAGVDHQKMVIRYMAVEVYFEGAWMA